MFKSFNEIVIVNERLYHLGIKKGDLADNVFLVGDQGRVDLVASFFDSIEHSSQHREFVCKTGMYKGKRITALSTGIGTDNVEIALVEAYIAHEFDLKSSTRNSGCRPMTFIRLGTSGGVQPDIKPGTLAIASYALGLDSTGVYYEQAPEDGIIEKIESSAEKILTGAAANTSRFKGKIIPYASKASPEVTKALANQAKKAGSSFGVGITVSSPGFYGPSSRYIDGLKNTLPDIKGSLSKLNIDGLKVLNMEMESSLLFHLCSQMGYHAGTICTVISTSKDSDAVVNYDQAIASTIEIGLKALVELKTSA